MLTVKTPEEVLEIIDREFAFPAKEENVPLDAARGRVLSGPVLSEEYVPTFNRSTVDGYAVKASDTFGCSDSIPAILNVAGEILMGEDAEGIDLKAGDCAYIPTGGAVPQGADAVGMIEYTEDYHDGTIGILKPVAPGENMILKGDDVFPGKEVLPKGRLMNSADIGALAALGITSLNVSAKPVIGIISTGDELVNVDEKPADGQVRDVNSTVISALVSELGANAICYGIVKDDERLLGEVLDKAVSFA